MIANQENKLHDLKVGAFSIRVIEKYGIGKGRYKKIETDIQV
jgi:hypothetical protein